MTAPVLIAGAGPVGLTAALALARHGVPSVLIDRGDGVACVGSRSICTARWTLEAFERLGCGRRMADEGVSWTIGRTYFRDVELFETRFPAVGREVFPPFINLGQERVEGILLERVAAEPLIETRWHHTLAWIGQSQDRVTAVANTPSGQVTLEASHLIGCDGARSTTRRLLELDFRGHSHTDKFLIIDLRADLPFADERRFFFDHPRNPGRQVLIHPQPDKVWRIDWQVPADLDLDEEGRSGRLDRRIRDLIGDIDYEIVWESAYVFHQRRAPRFRVGRVFLAGDAAHVFSPFGARGMNSGVQDAENLAWKLWLVREGSAPEALLDTYDSERGAAADHNLAVTDATMRFMAPSSAPRRIVRDLILRGSVRVKLLRRLVNSGRLSQPFAYRDSPIVATRRGTRRPAAAPGCVAPDAPCQVLGHDRPAERLRDLLGRGFVALRFDARPDPAFDAAAGADQLLVATELFTVVAQRPAVAPVPTVVDSDGLLTGAYGARPGDLVLIRPDGHIAAHQPAATARDLDPLVSRATLQHSTTKESPCATTLSDPSLPSATRRSASTAGHS
jgi:2-polyprenyl-6-methoxyphenol hydroxylase-like FAD-dependent oxidoreductase